jgi:predicted RNase H-like HicB family nuclease
MNSNGGSLGQRYSMLIQWSDEDAAYIVSVPELPGCTTHGATRLEAVEQGEEALAGWLEAAEAWGRTIPPPQPITAEENTATV